MSLSCRHDIFQLEVCVDNVESIRNAIKGGADRLELCSGLSEGGLTPSIGLAQLAKRISPVPVFAMLRLRGGNFVYTPDEIDAMLLDMQALRNEGIDGFVFGALTSDDRVDKDSCGKIIEAADKLPVTFHRAFDEAHDPLSSMEVICKLGFKRILTSGQCKSAIEGSDLIKNLIDQAQDRIIVMPGGGVTGENIARLRDETGANEFHGSAKRSTVCDSEIGIAHNALVVTDADTVKQMIKNLRG